MKKICVIDIETTDWTNFACLGFFDGYEYKVFWSVEGFLDHFLTYKYYGWTCYAHFGGRFDFRFLLPVLMEEGKYEISMVERSSRFLKIKVRNGKNCWTFSDSLFLLPGSLKELSKTFKVNYLKKEFDVESCKSIEDWSKPEPQEYLRYDCFGLYEILEKFSQWGPNRGVLKSTIPSQSLYVFTKNYLKEKLFPLRSEQEDFIREGYYGGRVEVFKMYGKNLYYYDFNSLYPFEMLKESPLGYCVPVTERRRNRLGFYLIHCLIPENLEIPPLPLYRGHKLFFPVGEGEYYVTSVDLDLLEEMGIDYEIKKGYEFTDRACLFKEYVDEMYKMRLNSEKGSLENYTAKLFMNSLYGKFGQRRDNEQLIYSKNPKRAFKVYDEEFGLYTESKVSKSPYILPHIASLITSRARNRLYRAMLEVGLENVWYCDTDSIITSKKLKTGLLLGDLKLEYEIEEGVFLQPKAYALKLKNGKQIVKVKGMRGIEKGFEVFKQALDKNDMSLINSIYYNIAGFRETLKKERNVKVKRVKIFKQLSSLYSKRQIIGQNTRPFSYKYLIDTFK